MTATVPKQTPSSLAAMQLRDDSHQPQCGAMRQCSFS